MDRQAGVGMLIQRHAEVVIKLKLVSVRACCNEIIVGMNGRTKGSLSSPLPWCLRPLLPPLPIPRGGIRTLIDEAFSKLKGGQQT